MIYVLQNSIGEKAVVCNWTGWQRVLKLCPLAMRFKDACVIHRLPVDLDVAGSSLLVRGLIESLGACYPQPNSYRLAVMNDVGEILFGPCDKIELAKLTGTARRTVVRAVTRQVRLSPKSGGYVVHLWST